MCKMSNQRRKIFRKKLLKSNPYCCYCNHRLVDWCVSLNKFQKKCQGKTWLSKWHATLEHIIPRSQGGKNVLSNLMLACRKCNQERNDGDLLELCMN